MSNNNYIYKVRVEFEDVDSYGIAHHSRLINMLERARVNFFHEQGCSVSDGSFNLVLVNLNVNFKNPARVMEDLDIALSLERISHFSLTFGYQIKKQETLVLEASVKMASVDQNTRPVIFPDQARKALNKLK
jgi:YbgC/YbaW family acyl-CoA thioester hydrolase